MSIYINKDTRVITQGITGKTGQFHTEKCQEYANGKNCFVAGVNPKKAGESIFKVVTFEDVVATARAEGLFEWLIPAEGDLDARAKSTLGRMLKTYDRRLLGGFRFSLVGRGRNRRFRVERVHS